jgi:hypothetical protein
VISHEGGIEEAMVSASAIAPDEFPKQSFIILLRKAYRDITLTAIVKFGCQSVNAPTLGPGHYMPPVLASAAATILEVMTTD